MSLEYDCLLYHQFYFFGDQIRFSYSVYLGAFLMAFLTSACNIICTVSTISAMSYGKVSVVTMFCLAGGMIVPFVFGIVALNETAGSFKRIGMAILCLSLVPALMQKWDGISEKNAKFIIYNIVIFSGSSRVMVG